MQTNLDGVCSRDIVRGAFSRQLEMESTAIQIEKYLKSKILKNKSVAA